MDMPLRHAGCSSVVANKIAVVSDAGVDVPGGGYVTLREGGDDEGEGEDSDGVRQPAPSPPRGRRHSSNVNAINNSTANASTATIRLPNTAEMELPAHHGHHPASHDT